MLCLIKKKEIINSEIRENDRFNLLEGEVVSPAYHGWTYNDYKLLEIQEADQIPEGKVSEKIDVVFDGKQAKYVHTLKDFVQPTINLNSEVESSINSECQRRIEDMFVFYGKLIDNDAVSQRRLSNAAFKAMNAIMNGVKPKDFYWHLNKDEKDDPSTNLPFKWITEDNTELLMDAQEIIDMQNAAHSWEHQNVLAAKKLKKMEEIPENYKDDEYWP